MIKHAKQPNGKFGPRQLIEEALPKGYKIRGAYENEEFIIENGRGDIIHILVEGQTFTVSWDCCIDRDGASWTSKSVIDLAEPDSLEMLKKAIRNAFRLARAEPR